MKEIKTLIDEEKLQERIKQLGEQLTKVYEGEEVTVVCILKGSIYFTVDLTKHIKNDKLQIEFIQLSSYGKETISSGKVDMRLDLRDSVEGKNLLIVEDIIDTGRTLKYLIEYLKTKNAKTIKLCTLLDKPERREYDINVDFVGFNIPNKFVLGYGLDYEENYRNLPYIGYIED